MASLAELTGNSILPAAQPKYLGAILDPPLSLSVSYPASNMSRNTAGFIFKADFTTPTAIPLICDPPSYPHLITELGYSTDLFSTTLGSHNLLPTHTHTHTHTVCLNSPTTPPLYTKPHLNDNYSTCYLSGLSYYPSLPPVTLAFVLPKQ